MLYAPCAMRLREERRSTSSKSFLPHFAKLLHHLPSLAILFKKSVDILNAGSTASSNPQSSTSIDGLIIGSLLGCHGIDDGLHFHQFLFIEIKASHSPHLLRQARDHPQDGFQRPHFSNL